jgi:hypothetical protein
MNINHRKRISPVSHSHPTGRRLLARLLLLSLALAVTPHGVRAQVENMFVLDEATEGAAYMVQVTTAGTAPYTWTHIDGTPPPGLHLTSDGKLTGTPGMGSASVNPYRFKVRVTDSSNPQRTNEQWLSVTILPPTSLIGPAGRTVVAAPTPLPPPPPPFVLTTSTADEETIALTQMLPTAAPPPNFNPDTDPANLVILQTLIRDTIKTSTQNFQVGDYSVVHVIWWKDINAENKSEPDREIWALFKAKYQDAANVRWEEVIDPKNAEVFNTRILGQKRVAVLVAHLNTPRTWDVKYKVTITQKIPVPIQHALELASSVTGGGAGLARNTKDIWGARMMLVKYTASDLVVKVNAVSSSASGRPVEQSKEHSKTYDNEGKYHWDVSVGLPVQSVRELRFKSDGNRVFAESKEKQSIYGFLNIYPKAVDLKSDKFFTVPHFVLGVPLASKPLHRPFVGVGTGLFKMPIKFNLFAGIVFIRERVPRTLGEGAAATTGQLEADLHTRWVRKAMFGINLPVSQIKDAIKSK